MKRFPLYALLVCFWLSGCNLPASSPTASPQDWLATSVAATVSAMRTLSAPSATPLPALQATPLPSLTPTPVLTSTPLPTHTPLVTATPEPGSLRGAILGYPLGGSPRFTVVAYEQNPPYHYWYWITAPGATSYAMNGYVSPGVYQVVAYSSDGLRGGCVNLVEVKSNQVAVCDITDWSGAYRDKPAGVP